MLVTPGHVAVRRELIVSRFGIVGPPDDPAGVGRATGATDAFARIAVHGATFVSRGDSSGTHVKELALWAAAGIRPPLHGAWYLESGADQASTLHIADERGGYALADLPTFARLTGVRLRVLLAGDSLLRNPYTLYVVRRPTLHPAARDFATWATGPWRDALLRLRLPDGTPAFSATPETAARIVPLRSQAPAASAVMLGTWESQASQPSRTPPTLHSGLSVTVEIDSVIGATRFRGSVRRWIAGDMGVPPTAFGAVTGAVAGGGQVSFDIIWVRPGQPSVTVRGRLEGNGDTLVVNDSRQGAGPGPFSAAARFVRVGRTAIVSPR